MLTRILTTIIIIIVIITETKTELLDIDRKTRTLLKAYHVFHNKSNVEKLYLPRKDGAVDF